MYCGTFVLACVQSHEAPHTYMIQEGMGYYTYLDEAPHSYMIPPKGDIHSFLFVFISSSELFQGASLISERTYSGSLYAEARVWGAKR